MMTTTSFKQFLLTLTSIAICAGLSGCAAPQAPIYDQPPIILVDIDTLRADHLGCYGYSRDTSPEIDEFAEQAARFEWTFSQGPNTPPSQASILTSLYPSTHGRIHNKQMMSDEAETLAERLRDAGYRTTAFVNGGLMAKGFGLEQGFELYDDKAGGVEKSGPKAERWIDGHLKDAKTANRPFFLLLHTYDVHSPYESTPTPYRDRYLKELENPPSEDFRAKMSGRMARISKARDQRPYQELEAHNLEYAKAMYDGGIRHVDAWFGELKRFLVERNLYEQSIIAIISDHGDTFQEHGDLFHGQIYSPVTRIPMIIRFPQGELAGVYEPVTESIDLMPTLLDRVGVESPPAIQGQSLLPFLEGRASAGSLDRIAVSESPFDGGSVFIASDTHRLFAAGSFPDEELYHYRQDPLEQRDLSAEHPELVSALQQERARWREKVTTAKAGPTAMGEVDAETLEHLVLLGYVDEEELVDRSATPPTSAPPTSSVPLAPELFADGFESGDAGAWSNGSG